MSENSPNLKYLKEQLDQLDNSMKADSKLRRALSSSQESLDLAVQALNKITNIKNQSSGGGWDEIEEARKIAKEALDCIQTHIRECKT